MNTEQWLDRWLGSRVVGPKTLERYERAVESLKKSLMFIDISEINPELVEKICGEDPSLRSVLSMALGEAVKASLLKSNPAVIKREQRSPKEGSLFYRANHDYVKLSIIVVMQSWPLCELETESRRQWPFSLEIALHNIPDWKSATAQFPRLGRFTKWSQLSLLTS